MWKKERGEKPFPFLRHKKKKKERWVWKDLLVRCKLFFNCWLIVLLSHCLVPARHLEVVAPLCAYGQYDIHWTKPHRWKNPNQAKEKHNKQQKTKQLKTSYCAKVNQKIRACMGIRLVQSMLLSRNGLSLSPLWRSRPCTSHRCGVMFGGAWQHGPFGSSQGFSGSWGGLPEPSGEHQLQTKASGSSCYLFTLFFPGSSHVIWEGSLPVLRIIANQLPSLLEYISLHFLKMEPPLYLAGGYFISSSRALPVLQHSCPAGM